MSLFLRRRSSAVFILCLLLLSHHAALGLRDGSRDQGDERLPGLGYHLLVQQRRQGRRGGGGGGASRSWNGPGWDRLGLVATRTYVSSSPFIKTLP